MVWSEWRLDLQGRYNCCLDMIVIMQDIAYRLLFLFDQAKMELFEVCRVPEGTAFDQIKVQQVVSTLLDRRQACDKCVDLVFTAAWAHRLANMGSVTCRRAHTSVCDTLALSRLTSVLVERKHLIGQELKPKKRGRGPTCQTVAETVFRKSLVRAGERHASEAKLSTLGKDPKVLNSFMLSLGSSAIAGHADRRRRTDDDDGKRKALKVLKFEGRLQAKKKRGYDVYVASHYHPGIEADHVLAKKHKLNTGWGALSDADKNMFKAQAAVFNEEADKVKGENFKEFSERQQRLIVTKKDRKRKGYQAEKFGLFKRRYSKSSTTLCISQAAACILSMLVFELTSYAGTCHERTLLRG